jgi:4-amino-4-deoxy-L-arabinose transferase-like glycosyltransferase
MKPRHEKLSILAIFILALTLRVVFAWPALSGAEEFGQGDDDDYYRLGMSIAQTGALADYGKLSAYRMPFFPITIAPFHYFLGAAPHAAQPLIVVLSALTCVGVYLLGRELFQPQVGLVAAALSAINLQLVIYSRVLMTETLFIFLVLAGMLGLERVRKTQRWSWAIVTGVILGLATLTRANFGPFVLFAVVWLFLHTRQQIGIALRNTAIIAGLVGIFWGGWVVRNYIAFDAFIPFTTQGGNAYYGIYNDTAAQLPPGRYGNWINREPPVPVSSAHEWSEVDLDRLQRSLAFDWIKAHPALSAKIALMQGVYFWWPDENDRLSFWLTPLALIGLIIAVRRWSHGVILWMILAGVFTIMAIASVGVARYQLPLYPIVSVLIALPCVLGWQRASTRLVRIQQIARQRDERI